MPASVAPRLTRRLLAQLRALPADGARSARPGPLAASLLAAGLLPAPALAQSDPGNVPIFFTTPVQGTVFLDNPADLPYQVYAPSGAFTTDQGGRLVITDGSFLRFGGTILNDGSIELRRDPSGRIGSIAIPNSGGAIHLNVSANNTSTTDNFGVLRMLGGSIYNPYNFFFPGPDTARLVNGAGHLITNHDGIAYAGPAGIGGTPPAYTGNFASLQLSNNGDIESVRTGGLLTFSLSALSNTGGAGQHGNSATGRIFAHNGGAIHLSIRHGGGLGFGSNAFNTFTNFGLITTHDPSVAVGGPGVLSGGGTIRLSSLVNLIGSGWQPGVFQGHNPEIVAGGRLELDEIRFVNTTIAPSEPDGDESVTPPPFIPAPKTLTAQNGTVRLENGVTILGGRVAGDTGSSRFEIGFGGAPAGGFANTFEDVEFDGTFYAQGHLRLLGSTDISGATFRALQPGAGYTLALGSDFTLDAPRTYFGPAAFTTDSSVTRRTLTLDATLTAPDSIGFSHLALAGSGTVDSPILRIGEGLDLTNYGGVLRPRANGQLRLESGTFTFPFSPKLSSSGATLVLDAATLNLSGQTLAPAGLNTRVRLENDSVLANGRLLAGFGAGGLPTGTFHIEQGRLRNLTFDGMFSVGQSVTLENARPDGPFTGFHGGDYRIELASSLDLAGSTLRLLSTGTVTLDRTASFSGYGLPTGGSILADRLRLGDRIGGITGGASFIAGPSGELHLTLGYTASGTDASGSVVAYTDLTQTHVDGDLRLDYLRPSSAFWLPDSVTASLFGPIAVSVDGRLTVLPHIRLAPSAGSFSLPAPPPGGLSFLPSALAARSFRFESNDLSGLHLRPFDPATPATVLLSSAETNVLAGPDTTTFTSGGTIIFSDPSFIFSNDPGLGFTRPYTVAVVAPPAAGISAPGQVVSNGTLVFSGLALQAYVSESITPPSQSYLPRVLPDASQLGTITAQHITLREGTQAHLRYDREVQIVDDGFVVGEEVTRRWTLAPNLVATGDQSLGTLGELRLETGRYSLEPTWTYGRLVLGEGATLTQRSLLESDFWTGPSFVGDPLAADPDLTPLPDTPSVLEALFAPGLPYSVVLDGGRLEAMTLRTLPAPFSYGSDRSGALVQSRATFAANSQLLGTLDHASGAVTRFEAGYIFPRGTINPVTGDHESQVLRSAPHLASSDQHFGIEIESAGPYFSEPVPVVVPESSTTEEATRLEGNVTVTGVVAPGGQPRAQLLLEGSGIARALANLRHTGADLTFTGPLDVIVNGTLASTGLTTFAPGVGLSGTGTAESVGGFRLNGQTLPGNSPGTLTLIGDVTFGDTHNLILEIGFGPFDSDRLYIEGNLTVGGALTLVFINGYNPLAFGGWPNTAFGQLLSATGTTSGSFQSLLIEGLDDPSVFQLSQLDQILPSGTYADLQVIPEPSTYAPAAALAALGLALSRRRRRTA
jgi:MYXO-CTERM domain-containing protein